MAGEQRNENGGPEANEEAQARAEAWGLDSRAPGWEYLDFSDDKGEKPVVNSATGKERTFSEFDLYPRQEGKSSEEYGAILKDQHEKTAQYLEGKIEPKAAANANYEPKYTAEEKEAIIASLPPSERAALDAFEEKINKSVADEKITQENADKMLERKLGQLQNAAMNAAIDAKDRQTVGSKEEDERLEAHWRKLENPNGEEDKKELNPDIAYLKESLERGFIDQKEYDEGVKNLTKKTAEEIEKELDSQIKMIDTALNVSHSISQADYDNNVKKLIIEAGLENTEKYKRILDEIAKREPEEKVVEPVDNRTPEEKAKELDRQIGILKYALEKKLISQKEYDDYVKQYTEEAGLEDAEKAKRELEMKAKYELEVKAKRELEEKAKRKNGQNENESNPDKIKPLTAINADFSLDRKNLAHQAAETISNQESSTGNYFKRLWKGTLFKKYFVKKYERELLMGSRTTIDGDTIDDLIEKRKAGAMERFELAVTESMAYLHSEIGKKDKNNNYKDGEEINPADERTQEFVKEAITEFVEMSKKYKNMNSDELKKQFIEHFNRKQRKARENGEKIDTDVTNYGEVALQALELTMHGVAIENVMDGFKVYNAKANDEIRTEAHRDAIDKIINAVESSKIGQFIPAETIALVVGTTASIAQIGARRAANAFAPIVGGILVSSTISGLRERNRITEDRAHMMRDIANGLEYQGVENPKNRRERYEARIGGTLYPTSKATDLVKGIEDALKTDGEGRSEAILSALAEARIRRDYSDSEQKDLISFSSADNRGKERAELDKALIRAERALSEADNEKYKEMKEYVRSKIIDGYDTEDGEHIAGVTEQDKKFANRRALMATLKAGKTAAIGGGIFFAIQAVQEIAAIIDPGKIGIFEKAGLIKTNNDLDAKETMFAGAVGPRSTYERIIGNDTQTVSGNDTQEMQRLSNEGYHGTMVNAPYTTTSQSIVEVDPASSDLATPTQIDAWADYGTPAYKAVEYNERAGHIINGAVVFKPVIRESITPNGTVIDVNKIAADDKIKGFLTLGKQRFEIAMEDFNTWGKNGVFTVKGPDGSVGTVKAIDDSGKFIGKYFEIAQDNGVINGVQHITPLATIVGPDSFDGKMTQVIETTVEHPAVFEFTKTITESVARDVAGTAGIAFAPDTARQGLGVATAADTTQETGDTPVEPVNVQPTSELSGQPEKTDLEEQAELSTMIYNLASSFGGDEAVHNIMMQAEPTEQDLGPDGNYSKWWNSLTPEAQMSALGVFEAIKRADENRAKRGLNPISWGTGIRKWVLDELS